MDANPPTAADYAWAAAERAQSYTASLEQRVQDLEGRMAALEKKLEEL